MSGLTLRTGVSAGISSGSGSYTPLTPASASPPTATSGTIAQAAYGISGGGGSDIGPRTAAVGSVAIGIASLALLVYLWWSLPR